MQPKSLPDTLHSLLQCAVNDARGLNRRCYKPRYDEWHSPDLADGRCEVCLAGSCLAGTIGHSSKDCITPFEFPANTRRKLEALEAMRTGSWIEAYRLVHQQRPPIETEARLSCLPAPAWSSFTNWRAFNSHLKSLEAILPMLRSIEARDPSIISFQG